MEIKDTLLWKTLNERIKADSEYSYIAGIEAVCNYGVERAKTIRDTFPMYTLHDETHICNVMTLMVNILCDKISELSCDEVAMLILVACCHDIGMSYSDADKLELLDDVDRLNKYLDAHHSEYVKAYEKGGDKPCMTDDMMQNYLRCIHHERIADLLSKFEWPSALKGKVDCDDLIRVCQSHGQDIKLLIDLESTLTIDLRFCAILLRLSDILDFDTSRAPQVLYDYNELEHKEDIETSKSKDEWDKHMASHGFDFDHIADRSYPYDLNYKATCKSMKIEQMINCYLDWVDIELNDCGKQIGRFKGKWDTLILPAKVKRIIKSEGYVSGQYRLTLDQNQVIDLLIGRDLYNDPAVFVRELIQNAIDAVRTREQLDKNKPSDWKPQINIRSWVDGEGYHWFRIEDNGIGMTEETIMNYFLKVGSSYYNSDTFKQEKIRCKADPDYMPISRFGIGILSCFMSDMQGTQVEVSTKHFTEEKTYYPALRLSMHGINGYYYLANKDKNHLPEPMKGVTTKEKDPFLKQGGTVIAVRTNLYQTRKYRNFKEIIDRYVVYPSVNVHYDGVEGSYDYHTETDFMKTIHEINPSEDTSKHGIFEFPLSIDQINEICSDRPEIAFLETPKVVLKCIPLDYYTNSPYMNGAILTVKTVGKHDKIKLAIGKNTINAEIALNTTYNPNKGELGIKIGLTFPREFTDKMRLFENSYESNRNEIRECVEVLCEKYDWNAYGYIGEIGEAILRGYLHEKGWKKYMRERYAINPFTLDEIIQNLKSMLDERLGISLPSEDELKLMHEFDRIKKEWQFKLCDLMQFKWYKDHFDETLTRLGRRSITSHNGVLCGDAHYFFDEAQYSSNNNLGTIVLLKDKYRPYMDISREGIRRLTIENHCDLETIKANVYKEGFIIKSKYSVEENYQLPMYEYWRILDEREDIYKKIMISTKEGDYVVDDLHAKVEKHTQIELMNPCKISPGSYYSETSSYLYRRLGMALLCKEFSLRLKFDGSITSILLLKKELSDQDMYADIFPPNFFVLALDGNCEFLTSKSTYYRNACNANHRFSKWFHNNSYELKKRVPGIFYEMMRALSEQDGKDLIKNINHQLSYIQKLPSSLFNIPNEIFLTENDLN